jgi:hypothetical protein
VKWPKTLFYSCFADPVNRCHFSILSALAEKC